MSGMLLGRVLEMSLVGSYSILLVLAVRALLSGCERKYSYWLWLVVFLKLCIPFSIHGRFSLIPGQLSGVGGKTAFDAENGTGNGEGNGAESIAGNGTTEETKSISKEAKGTGKEGAGSGAQNRFQTAAGGEIRGAVFETAGDKLLAGLHALWRNSASVLETIWLAGIAGIFLFNLRHVWRIKKAVAPIYWDSWDAGRRIAEVEGLPAPFLWGMLRPVILLPTGLDSEERKYIAAHEMCHRRRRDPAVKAAVFCVAALHWFNPLVWLAWACFCRDMEISCDEAVLSRAKGNIKKQYARSLLKYAAKQNGYLITPLTFGEPSVKQRIKKVLRFRKRNAPAAAVAGICVLVVALGLIVRPDENGAAQGTLAARLLQHVGLGSEREDIVWQYYVETGEDGTAQAGIYRYDSKSAESTLVAAGSFIRQQEDEAALYVSRREDAYIYFDCVHKEDGRMETNLTGQAVEAEQITAFYADENYILYGAGQYEGSMGLFRGAFYSFDRGSGALTEKKPTDADRFTVVQDHVYYQRYWNQGEGENQLCRADYTFSDEEQVGEELHFILWNPENGSLLVQKGDLPGALVWVDPDGENERVFLEASALSWDTEPYDKLRFQDVRMEGEDIFAVAELWGYREEMQETYGWRDSLIRWASLRIRADGSGFEVLEEGTEEPESGELSADSQVRHREGYQKAELTLAAFHPPLPDATGLQDQERREALAQQAIRELYDLTGFLVESCVYAYAGNGTFWFGKTEDDIDRSRIFYTRTYGEAQGFDAVAYMSFADAGRVWYSDVQQLDVPVNAAGMDNGDLAVWFLERCAVYQGEEIAGTRQMTEADPELIQVLLADGGFYEVKLDRQVNAACDICGPFSAEHAQSPL